ncbi:MAG: SDR family oxidoreductase [Cyclobacteriaceae bacterium]
MFDLSAKTAVITGGGSGIGKAIALVFAGQGAQVMIIDVNVAASEATVNEIEKEGGSATFFECDIVNQKAVLDVFDNIADKTGSLDILVNNAGVAGIGTIEETTEADMDRLYNINVKGAYNCSLAAVKKMKVQGKGCILNMASVAAVVGLASRFAYSMTKGAILSMTYSLAKDYIAYGVRCNSISPGRVHTPFVDGYLAQNYPGQEAEMFDKLSKTQPIGRMGQPSEIAHLALYLCSDEAGFVTGSNYYIDGGFATLNT